MRTSRLLLPLLVLALGATGCQKEVAVGDGTSGAGADGGDVTSEAPVATGDDAATGDALRTVDGQGVTEADCWVVFTYDGEGATQEWEGPIAGTAEYVGSSGRSLAVLNVDLDEQRTDDVRTMSLTDTAPQFAQVTFAYLDEPTGMTLGELGTYQVEGGARLHGGDEPFNVAGVLEFTITRSEFQQTDGGPKFIDAFAGTFRNVGPLVFQNPFPENGKRGEVTDLHGEFNIDRRGCTLL